MKTEVKYPYNLLEEIFGDISDMEIPADILESLDYALSTLAENEEKILRMRCQEGKTYREIGEIFHLSTSRIQQITARSKRKLRHPSRTKYLKFGIAEIEKRKTKIDPATAIEDLNLSYRAFNCLKRAGINTVKDIICMGSTELANIRNLGKISYHEVVSALGQSGISLESTQTKIIGRSGEPIDENSSSRSN